MSRDFELGRNLSGDFRKSLTYLLLLVIWVCLSDKWAWHLLVSTRVRRTALAMLTPARPQTVDRTKKLFRNVTCLFRCCLMSVSTVALSSGKMLNKHQVPFTVSTTGSVIYPHCFHCRVAVAVAIGRCSDQSRPTH